MNERIKVANIEPRKLEFEVEDLIQKIPAGEPFDKLVPRDAFKATIVVEEGEPVKVVFECMCDSEIIRVLAPELLAELVIQPEFKYVGS